MGRAEEEVWNGSPDPEEELSEALLKSGALLKKGSPLCVQPDSINSDATDNGKMLHSPEHRLIDRLIAGGDPNSFQNFPASEVRAIFSH